jgi:hypothetical protein
MSGYQKFSSFSSPPSTSERPQSLAGLASLAGTPRISGGNNKPLRALKITCPPAKVAKVAKVDPYDRTLAVLRERCPVHVEPERWHQCVADAESFLAQWGEQAEALGWTSADLLGLHEPPERPHPSYRRLSRYDATGLVWLLQGRPVVAMTEATASIRHSTGAITVFRKSNRPALGPLGDSLDDF